MRGIFLTIMAGLIIFIIMVLSPFWLSAIHEAIVYQVGWTVYIKNHVTEAHPSEPIPFWISVIVSFAIYFFILVKYIKWRDTY